MNYTRWRTIKKGNYDEDKGIMEIKEQHEERNKSKRLKETTPDV